MTILKLIWLTVLYERPPCVSGTCSNNDNYDDDDDDVLVPEILTRKIQSLISCMHAVDNT